MNSERSSDFNQFYFLLPAHVRERARKAYGLWRDNPSHPSLHFKEWAPGCWSIRIGKQYRALGEVVGGTLVWNWIGSHNAYDKRLRERR